MAEIILINGKKRSGKDFFAEKLQEELYKNQFTSEIIAFADPIKDIIAKTFNISDEDLDNFKNDKIKIAAKLPKMDGYDCYEITDFRKVLQNFGTEAMKTHFGEDVWVNLLRDKVNKSNVDYVIVPDFRFLSENISSISIKIENKDVEEGDGHRSETELDNFHFRIVIENTGQPDLTDQVQEVVRKIKDNIL